MVTAPLRDFTIPLTPTRANGQCDTSPPLVLNCDERWDVKHSTTGYVFKLVKAAISWASAKQPTVALSSCEPEIMALSEASKETLGLHGLLDELGVLPAGPTTLATDNSAARGLAYNPEYHKRVKHIERRHFFVRECVGNFQLVVPRMLTMLTSSQSRSHQKVFYDMRERIMNVPPSCRRPGRFGVQGGVE